MRKTITALTLGLALGVPLLTGCNHLLGVRDRVPPQTPLPDRKADVPSLVNYLNQNAKLVQNVRAKIDMECKAGKQTFGLSGLMACQKPRDFRLKADVLGKPAADIGSNSEEFWYWLSQGNPPRVYHCSYRELSTGKVPVPFPFQPDMVLAALGMADYNDKDKFELKESPKTLELVHQTTGTNGKPVRRITVFNRIMARPGEPQVLAHVLQDAHGKLICRATVHKIMVDRHTNAVIPTRVKIEWPAEQMAMTMDLRDVQSNVLDPTMSARLFQRADLNGHDSFDLARGLIDTPGTVRRAGSAELPRR